MAKSEKILIVGAGPAGLAIAGRLSKRRIPYRIIERSERVANSWYHHYDRLCLHTVKQYSHLPHFPFPDSYPTYVSREQLYNYYQEYVKKMEIQIDFGQTLEFVRKTESGYLVQLKGGAEILTEHLIIATGINRKPRIPHWPNQEEYGGSILHSIDYKNADPFKDQRVLVVGMGNTGAEIALDLAENHIQVCLSVRSPVNIVPRDVAGSPTQITAMKLAVLPNWLNDWIGNQLQKLTIGDLRKYGIKTDKMPPGKQLRELGKTPVIDLGTVEQIKKGNIKVLGDIRSFHSKGIISAEGKSYDFDSVVLATGFTSDLQDFLGDIPLDLDAFGQPKDCIATGELSGLYFLGFDNYRPGGILGIILQDSLRIADQIEMTLSYASSAR